MNNALVGSLVAVFAFLLVGGAALLGVHVALGEWSPLLWLGLGIAALMGVMRRVNA